jgi:hypothetical protein
VAEAETLDRTGLHPCPVIFPDPAFPGLRPFAAQFLHRGQVHRLRQPDQVGGCDHEVPWPGRPSLPTGGL